MAESIQKCRDFPLFLRAIIKSSYCSVFLQYFLNLYVLTQPKESTYGYTSKEFSSFQGRSQRCTDKQCEKKCGVNISHCSTLNIRSCWQEICEQKIKHFPLLVTGTELVRLSIWRRLKILPTNFIKIFDIHSIATI